MVEQAKGGTPYSRESSKRRNVLSPSEVKTKVDTFYVGNVYGSFFNIRYPNPLGAFVNRLQLRKFVKHHPNGLPKYVQSLHPDCREVLDMYVDVNNQQIWDILHRLAGY